MAKFLLETAANGKLPDGEAMKSATLSAQNIYNGWLKPYSSPAVLNKLWETVTDQADWTAPTTPADRFHALISDYGYRKGLFFVESGINLVKGNLFKNQFPFARKAVKNIANSGLVEKDAKSLLERCRMCVLGPTLISRRPTESLLAISFVLSSTYPPLLLFPSCLRLLPRLLPLFLHPS
jgi:hypothetical protein